MTQMEQANKEQDVTHQAIKFALLESTVGSLLEDLHEIKKTLKEIDGKLDTNILNQAIINTKMDAKNDNQDAEIQEIKDDVSNFGSKIAKVGTVVSAIIAGAITAIFRFFGGK